VADSARNVVDWLGFASQDVQVAEKGELGSRWALLASLALHAAIVVLAFRRPLSAAGPLRSDFWAGSTFEIPQVEDRGQGTSPEAVGENQREVDTDGIDPSPSPRGETSKPLPTSNPLPISNPLPAHRSNPSSHAATASSGAGSTGDRALGGSGSFGAEGAAPGVRDLVGSFARAIPMVASSDPVWATLPLGAAGKADITLVLDEEGKPHLKTSLDSAVPAHLARLVSKTLIIMSSGRFAIPSTGAMVGEQRLHIALDLTQQTAPMQDMTSSGGAFGLRFEPPDEHHVSRAFFTLASGRRVEVSVRPIGGLAK
jgi:hypothetical protein